MKRRSASLFLLAVLVSPAASAQPAAGAAERFKALYTREWTWRLAQYSGLDEDADRTTAVRDRFPKVDAATQTAANTAKIAWFESPIARRGPR